MSSKATPFVSGIMNQTYNNWQTIITAKKIKMGAPPNLLAKYGNILVIIAAKTQCVKLPKACPDARTSFGKISEINTQITAPCPIAWAAINAKTKKVIPSNCST